MMVRQRVPSTPATTAPMTRPRLHRGPIQRIAGRGLPPEGRVLCGREVLAGAVRVSTEPWGSTSANRMPPFRDRGYFFLLPPRLRPAPLFLGTFAPAFRASERPIAIACLRLVTFLPERPERNVPRLRSRIARWTLL